MARPGRRLALLLGLVAASAGSDLATKELAESHLAGSHPVHLLGGALRLTFVENEGAMLGLGREFSPGLRFWLLGVGVSLLLGLLLVWSLRERHRPLAVVLGLALVLGGGLGNQVDRLQRGGVRDFLVLRAGPLRTGIFNLADVAVTAGAALLLAGIGRTRDTTAVSPPQP